MIHGKDFIIYGEIVKSKVEVNWLLTLSSKEILKERFDEILSTKFILHDEIV